MVIVRYTDNAGIREACVGALEVLATPEQTEHSHELIIKYLRILASLTNDTIQVTVDTIN